MARSTFESLPLSSNKTVSWIHIGDTHLTRAGEQNEIDLGKIVDEINEVYAAGGVDFVFVPGDIADDGSVTAYGEFRKHLDRLKLPWCAIVGDHDVHEKDFANFKEYVAAELYSGFTVGPYRFLRLNAFSEPRPDSFILDEDQLKWLEDELKRCEESHQMAVLFLHCYPSDLRRGGEKLIDLLGRYPVLLIDMGHTHYNEISNDGKVLYTATRSTGQIEEGAPGYSLTTLDGRNVSWHFIEVGKPALVAITHPADERLLTERTTEEHDAGAITVHAKVWSPLPITRVSAEVGGKVTELKNEGGCFWTGSIATAEDRPSYQKLTVVAFDSLQRYSESSVWLFSGTRPPRTFKPNDQENAIGEWPERGILGSQLGPNKNGKKW